MTLSDNKSTHPASEPSGTVLDTKLLGQAIIELNIARKNFSIYPPGHAQLERSIHRAHDVLNRLLETLPELTAAVARDCLFVGGRYLDLKNPVFRDFSLALYGRDIAAVTFVAGVSKDDIHNFCRILTRDTFEIREAGGIRQVMRDASVTRIRVRPIDYSGLHLTEEQEILTSSNKRKPELSSHVWRSFVSHLLSGQLDSDGQLEHLAAKQKINPSQVAQLLNSGILDLKMAIDSYETTIAKYLRETTGDQPLEGFIALLKDLNPQLRSQFLSVTFDRMAEDGEEELFGCFPDEVVVEMLQQANDEGKEISPTLITLLEKISQLAVPQPLGTSGGPSTPAFSALPNHLSKEQMKNLLNREAYETYIDSDYRSLLKDLISQGHGLDAPENKGMPSSGQPKPTQSLQGMSALNSPSSESHQTTIDEHEIDAHLGQMMMALMEKSIESEDYLVFSRKLVSGVHEHLEHGEFDQCHEILQTFRRHSREKAEPIRQLAEDSILAFGAPHIVSAAVAALGACGEDQRERAQSFVAQIGPRCIPDLIDLYANEEYPSTKKPLLEILGGFGEEALQAVYTQFHGAPDHVLRNMLLLVQRIGSPNSAAHVRRLLNHVNRQVTMHALDTLLELKDPDSPLYLRRMLASADHDESLRCIALAGFYRISEVADDLAGMITTTLIRPSTLRRNEEILKSLARIGDVRIIPQLEEVARRSWTLSPRRLRHMKLTLFESLGGYPHENLTGLAQIGKKSRDTRIRMICAGLAQQDEGVNTDRVVKFDAAASLREVECQ